MSTDYHVAVDAIVEACKGVALLGRSEDASVNYDNLDAQFRFVEEYCARLFKIKVAPYAWLSVEESGDGINVSVLVDQAVWSNISARAYAEFSATKKDNRRKNKATENPDVGVAFDKWWEIVSNICQKAERGTCARILGSVGFMVALQQSGKCNYRKGSKVSRTTIEKMARASSINLGDGSSIGASDIASTIEIFLKKCCSAFVVEAGEREDAPIPPSHPSPNPTPSHRPHQSPRPTPTPTPSPRQQPQPRRPWPTPTPPPPPRPEPPRKQWKPSTPPPPNPQRSKPRKEWRPPSPPRVSETKSFWRKHPLFPVGIAAACVAGAVYFVQDNNISAVKEKVGSGWEAIHEGIKGDNGGSTPSPTYTPPARPTPTYTPPRSSTPTYTPSQPSPPTYMPPTTSGGTASRPITPEWPRPKDWFYNECNVIERNVQHYTGGGYRYDRSSARQISSQISTLKNQLSRNDVNGSVRAYNELKQVYNSFVNSCQWQANMRHPRYNHVVSSYTPNQWMAENGWEFVHPGTSDFSVRRKPIQVRCSSCRGHGYVIQKSRCYSCNGRGRVPNPAAQIGAAVNVVGGLVNTFGGKRSRPTRMPSRIPAEIKCQTCNGMRNLQQQVRCNLCNGARFIYK